MQKTNVTEVQMIAVGGVVYNRAHIVKVNICTPSIAQIFTTGGMMDEYQGETARQIAAFFSPGEPVPTEKERK